MIEELEGLTQAPPVPHPFRSVLRVDPTDPPAVDAALRSRADAIALDVAGSGEQGLWRAADLLMRPRDKGPRLLVRVSPPDEGGAAELAAVAPARPDAIVAARAETGADLQHIAAILAVAEAKAGLAEGAIGLVAIAETAASLFGLIGFAPATRRLAAIGWDAEALAADFGGEAARETDGRFSDPCQTARTLALAAAADARLPAIDAPFATRDREAFRREAERARRDGFAGKLALDARQAAILRDVFGQA